MFDIVFELFCMLLQLLLSLPPRLVDGAVKHRKTTQHHGLLL